MSLLAPLLYRIVLSLKKVDSAVGTHDRVSEIISLSVLSQKKVDSVVGTHDRVYERGYK